MQLELDVLLGGLLAFLDEAVHIVSLQFRPSMTSASDSV